MPKTTIDHGAYIRFRLPEADKTLFEEAATKMRLSLSAWLRLAGIEKAARDEMPREGEIKIANRSRGKNPRRGAG